MRQLFWASLLTAVGLGAATAGAAADKSSSQSPVINLEEWRRAEIASAVAVTDTYSFDRSDELVGTEVRNPESAQLGTVADVIQSRRTGKIAYLILDRGPVYGFGFGVGDKRVAVPWANFRITPTASLLVLNTTQENLTHAPTGYNRYSKTEAAADLQAQKIDAYWTAH